MTWGGLVGELSWSGFELFPSQVSVNHRIKLGLRVDGLSFKIDVLATIGATGVLVWS